MNDIEILEEFIEQYNASYPEEKEWVAIYPNQIEAIENLIQINKELEEENIKYPIKMNNEQYNKTINNAQKELKEKIEILKILAEKSRDLLDLYNKEKERNKDLEEIEKEHKKENGRLREENINLKEKIIRQQEQLNIANKKILAQKGQLKVVNNSYIPISKLKEKIEELNKEEKKSLKGTKGQDRYSIKLEYMHKRNALQELLEESEK